MQWQTIGSCIPVQNTWSPLVATGGAIGFSDTYRLRFNSPLWDPVWAVGSGIVRRKFSAGTPKLIDVSRRFYPGPDAILLTLPWPPSIRNSGLVLQEFDFRKILYRQGGRRMPAVNWSVTLDELIDDGGTPPPPPTGDTNDLFFSQVVYASEGPKLIATVPDRTRIASITVYMQEPWNALPLTVGESAYRDRLITVRSPALGNHTNLPDAYYFNSTEIWAWPAPGATQGEAMIVLFGKQQP